MELLLTSAPILHANRTVLAYILHGRWDENAVSAEYSPLLELLRFRGTEPFSQGKPLLAPVNEYALRSAALPDVSEPLYLLLEEKPEPQKDYISLVGALAEKGYRFAVQGCTHPQLLAKAEFLCLGKRDMAHSDRKALIRAYKKDNPSLKIVGTGVHDLKTFDAVLGDGCNAFCGDFFLTQHLDSRRSVLTALKVNLIHLLNMVRNDNFEFLHVADVVQQDPALTVSLLRFINSPYIGVRHRVHSIRQAVALLGQEEVRKWITATALRLLGTDHPGEWTRLSLLRAKFAESLAPMFGLAEESSSLFLTGLFSLLHLMLDVPMNEALDIVALSDDIRDALLEKSGRYGPVLRFMHDHEHANWNEILATMKGYGIQEQAVQEAYVLSLCWYNELLTRPAKPARKA